MFRTYIFLLLVAAPLWAQFEVVVQGLEEKDAPNLQEFFRAGEGEEFSAYYYVLDDHRIRFSVYPWRRQSATGQALRAIFPAPGAVEETGNGFSLRVNKAQPGYDLLLRLNAARRYRDGGGNALLAYRMFEGISQDGKNRGSDPAFWDRELSVLRSLLAERLARLKGRADDVLARLAQPNAPAGMLLLELKDLEDKGYMADELRSATGALLRRWAEQGPWTLQAWVPNEEGFMGTGMDAPLRFEVRGSNGALAGIPVGIEGGTAGYLQVQVAARALDMSGPRCSTRDEGTSQWAWVRSFATAERTNGVEVRVSPLLEQAVRHFAGAAGLDPQSVLRHWPRTLSLSLPLPSSFPSRQYRDWYRKYNKEERARLQNEYLSVALAANGQFTLGAERASIRGEGIPRMDLMYGHPNHYAADGIWSSYASIRIDGVPRQLYELEPVGDVHRQGERLISIREAPGLRVTQELSLVDSDESPASNRLLMAWVVSNTGSAPRRIDLRMLLDTWSGLNDGVPFRIPDWGGDQSALGKILISKERSIRSADLSWFEAYETRTVNRTMVTVGDLVARNGVSPDEVRLMAWGPAFMNVWEAPLDPDRRITGDSVAVYFWTNHILKPGEYRRFETRYGVRRADQTVSFPQRITPDNNPFEVVLSRQHDGAQTLRGSILLQNLPKGITLLGGQLGSTPYALDEGEETSLLYTFQAEPDAPAEFDLAFVIRENGSEKPVVCHIRNELVRMPLWTKPVVGGGEAITAQTVDASDETGKGRFFVAALSDRSGQVVERIVLHEEAPGTKRFSNAFKTRPPEGEYHVQIQVVGP